VAEVERDQLQCSSIGLRLSKSGRMTVTQSHQHLSLLLKRTTLTPYLLKVHQLQRTLILSIGIFFTSFHRLSLLLGLSQIVLNAVPYWKPSDMFAPLAVKSYRSMTGAT
jgi:hypothetical protein